MPDTVAPYVGAWIEMLRNLYRHQMEVSHPMWVRGLKYNRLKLEMLIIDVAPYVGAWIEMLNVI